MLLAIWLPVEVVGGMEVLSVPPSQQGGGRETQKSFCLISLAASFPSRPGVFGMTLARSIFCAKDI